MSTKFSERTPFENELAATRRPFTSVSVEPAPRPRSEAPAMPAGESACSAPEVAVLKLPVPPPVSEMSFSTSPIEASPRRSILTASMTCTGCASARSTPRRLVPVTLTASRVLASSVSAAGAGAWAATDVARSSAIIALRGFLDSMAVSSGSTGGHAGGAVVRVWSWGADGPDARRCHQATATRTQPRLAPLRHDGAQPMGSTRPTTR